jgi:hypothetical protein
MPKFIFRTVAGLSIAASLLSACATTVSVSDLSEANFGYRVFPHFDASIDPDPRAIANGLYAPQPLLGPCYWCSSQQSQLNWSGWSP